jgi:hypothetical protein
MAAAKIAMLQMIPTRFIYLTPEHLTYEAIEHPIMLHEPQDL